jgi:FAD/FMN-containing dehydrogenase
MTIAPSLTSADLAVAMAAATRGDVVTPDDPSYPAACFGYASAGEDAPEIVVIAADACDVVAAVRLAARSGRRVAVQATGHTAPGGGVGTILVVTRQLARVSIDRGLDGAGGRRLELAAGAGRRQRVRVRAGTVAGR